MSDMTEKEAWELDELLTKTTPEVDPSVQGPFIKRRNMMVILDELSAEYLAAKMLAIRKPLNEGSVLQAVRCCQNSQSVI